MDSSKLRRAKRRPQVREKAADDQQRIVWSPGYLPTGQSVETGRKRQTQLRKAQRVDDLGGHVGERKKRFGTFLWRARRGEEILRRKGERKLRSSVEQGGSFDKLVFRK